MRQCEICKKHNARICKTCVFPKQTLFEQITASPEVLAEKLVYRQASTVFIGEWRSVIIPVHIYGCFRTKEEAIAATVARLKEVCDE